MNDIAERKLGDYLPTPSPKRGGRIVMQQWAAKEVEKEIDAAGRPMFHEGRHSLWSRWTPVYDCEAIWGVTMIELAEAEDAAKARLHWLLKRRPWRLRQIQEARRQRWLTSERATQASGLTTTWM